MNAFAAEIERVARMMAPALVGRVSDVAGLTVSVTGLPAPIGTMCRIERQSGRAVEAQVVGFRDDKTLLMPLRDGLGRPIDGGPPVFPEARYPVWRPAPKALARRRIVKPLPTGVRALDGLVTAGLGQRIGLFAGTGVGKSVLLGMIARHTAADVNVVALIGERGREVRDFIEKDLGPEGLRRSVVVVATSDESPVLRVRAAFAATAIAEYFRDQGRHVLLLMDSLTRMAMAQRQIGLAAHEPPATRGYTPSVFGLIPQLAERAGQTEAGSITAFYSVLVEADDINDPIGDATRGVLDGHVWLSRTLAARAHYPAISIPDSISRVMPDVVDEQHVAAARTLRRALATWAEVEDLVNIGAYAAGSNPAVDAVIQARPAILAYLQQGLKERSTLEEARSRLIALAQQIDETTERLAREKTPPAARGSAAPAGRPAATG